MKIQKSKKVEIRKYTDFEKNIFFIRKCRKGKYYCLKLDECKTDYVIYLMNKGTTDDIRQSYILDCRAEGGQ